MGYRLVWPLLLLAQVSSHEGCARSLEEDPGQTEALVLLQSRMTIEDAHPVMTFHDEQAKGIMLMVPFCGLLVLIFLLFIGNAPLTKNRAPAPSPAALPTQGPAASKAPRSTWTLLLDTDVLCLMLVAFITGATAFMLEPLLPTMEHEMHLAPIALSILVISYNFSGSLSSSLLGHLADLRGAKEILMHCLLYLLIAMAMTAFLSSYPLLLVSRLLCGVFAHTFALFNKLLSDSMSAEEIAQAIGIIGMCINFGATAGSGLAGVVAGPRKDHRNFCLLMSAGALVTLFLSIFLKGGHQRARQTAQEPGRVSFVGSLRRVFFSHPLVGLMFWVHLINFTITPLNLQNLSYFVTEVLHGGVTDNGVIMFCAGGGLLLTTMLVLGPGVRRCGEVNLAFIAGLIHCAALALQLFAKTMTYGYVIAAVVAAANILVEPCCVAVVNRLTPPELAGTVGGIFGSSRSFGMLVGVLGQGVLYSGGGVYAAIYGSVALQVMSSLCQLPAVLGWMGAVSSAPKAVS